MGTQHIERAKKWMSGELPLPPIAQLIGFRPISLDLEKGEVTLEMEVSEKHHNPMGTLHGGVLCDIADLAMGMVFAASLEDGESFTTLELKMNFFRPVFKEKILATGRMVKRGKTVGMVECDVKTESGALVARVSSTCLVLRGQQASGR
ncbi:MAG TPA: PaaI family thioesterase [Candidatus Acidoferrales bacterium]